MSAVAEAPAPTISDDLRELCSLVAERDVVPVAELMKGMSDASLLAKAMKDGLIVIGRRSYSESIEDVRQKKEKGNLVYDPDTRRPVMDITTKVNVENEWSWFKPGEGRKSLRDLLDEEKKLPSNVPKLHVKVTTEGLAAAV